MRKIELLSPAGNFEKMQMVLHYGADAVYLGGKKFNLRALASNFSDEEMENAVKYAHNLDKKVYVTLNTIPHNAELNSMPGYVKFLEKLGVDGVIVADLGVFELVKENSNLRINVSTQASNTNWRSVKFWKSIGANRVILARELSLNEIKEIRDKVPYIELEVFVHGAMCMSISGRCLLSNYLTGRDANRGSCSHPCRWKYHLVEEKRPNEFFPVFEDESGSYIFNSKDLCTIEMIDKILATGVDSLKIEGRMKGIYHGALTTKVYRQAINSYLTGNFEYNPKWLTELETTSHRKYTNGFYISIPDETAQNYNTNSSYSQTHQIVAKVREKLNVNEYILEIRNKLYSGETVEIVTQNQDNKIIYFPIMYDIVKDENIEVANPNTVVKIEIEENLERFDLIRKKL